MTITCRLHPDHERPVFATAKELLAHLEQEHPTDGDDNLGIVKTTPEGVYTMGVDDERSKRPPHNPD